MARAAIPMLIALAIVLGACRTEAPKVEPKAIGSAEAATVGEAAPLGSGALVAAQQPAVYGPPKTEEALVEAMARAIAARDLVAMGRLAAPELSADLTRLHDQDPGAFWQKGQTWVVNARSGVSVAYRQDENHGRWRALVRFGNGADETVEVSRHDGALRFEQM